jgi:WD40 repeat protein
VAGDVKYPSNDRPVCVLVDSLGMVTCANPIDLTLNQRPLGGRLREVDRQDAWKNPFVVSLSPDGSRVAVANSEDGREVWDIDFETLQMKAIPLKEIPSISALAWVDNQRLLLASQRDNTVRLATLTDDSLLVQHTFSSHVAPPTQMIVSPDGQHACIRNYRARAPLAVALRDGAEFDQISGQSRRWVTAVTFSPDSRYLLWADWEGLVHVWHMAESCEVRCYRQHRSDILDLFKMSPHWIGALAVRADGNLAMSTGRDGKVRLWRLDHADYR